MTYFANYKSPLGVLTIASDGNHITGLWMEGQRYFCSTLGSDPVADTNIPVICTTMQWLDGYFQGTEQSSEHIPLLPTGTPFQQSVWSILREIPYGETVTYGKIRSKVAAALGKESMSAQAVGNAVGRNPISILIPCHRVVGTNGNLTGYAAGIERKKFLLELENAEV